MKIQLLQFSPFGYLTIWEEHTFEAPGFGLEAIPYTHGFIYKKIIILNLIIMLLTR